MSDNRIREIRRIRENPRFRRYPEYKESGVEWIGDIPAHWEVKRLKYVAEILPSNVDKHIYPDEIQIRLCNYTDVYYNDYITVDTVLKKGSCKEGEFAKFVLRKGNVIITKDSETPDDIGVPTFVKDDLNNVVCGYHLTMIRPLACRGEFIFRFIQSDRMRKYFELESNGVTRYGLGKSSIENLLLPIPTDSEQRQIANFLDRKTEQIDELIRIKERRIELLQEQRTALINQAVTKGLDPNVEMKPSGVEWIGEMPAHWEIKKIKQVATFVSEKSMPETDAIKISPENVESKTGKVLDFFSSYDSMGVKFQVGDVLFNKIRVYLNKVVFAEYSGYSLGEMIIIRPSLQDIGKYLFYLMLSSRFIEYCNSISRGAKMPRTDVYDILNAQIPITSYQEQTQIVDFLDRKTQQVNELIATEHRKIQLLQEYRQSLISEAVTGKIDVRNEV